MRENRIKKISKVFIVFLIVFFLIGNPVYAVHQRFTDVPTSAWHFQYIENLASQGIVGGFGTSGLFKPNDKVQRQHTAKMVVKAAGIPYQGKKANFPDVPPTSEMSPFIAALQERNIVSGYADGTFGPTKYVTRAEAAVMIVKAFGLKRFGTATSLKDTKGHWASSQIDTLLSNGIVKGYGDNTFKPSKSVTRAELAKMLNVAMVVKSMQTAESSRTKGTAEATKKLIDKLPTNQDHATRDVLLTRWTLVMLPNSESGWLKRSDEINLKGLLWEGTVNLTAHYNTILENEILSTGVKERIVPVFVKVHVFDTWGMAPQSFRLGEIEMVDSAGVVYRPIQINSKSTIGNLKLKSFFGNDTMSLYDGFQEGYLFYRLESLSTPNLIRYNEWLVISLR